MVIAAQAIGEGLLGETRASVAAFTLGLLLTFLGVRINTRLIRAKVKWWFHDIESEGGLHVHHMVIGVVLMVVTGLVLIAVSPEGLWLQVCALVFGAGVALTLDEFAPDPAPAGRLLDLGGPPLGGRRDRRGVRRTPHHSGLQPAGTSTAGLTRGAAAGVIAITVVIDLCFAVVCLLKGKYWTGFFGIFVPILGVVGAIRVARPTSPWAHKRYAKKPKKMAKAQRREDHVNATWRAWREAFFDLIAGKPHLPSVTTTAGAAEPADAAEQPAGRSQPAALAEAAPEPAEAEEHA